MGCLKDRDLGVISGSCRVRHGTRLVAALFCLRKGQIRTERRISRRGWLLTKLGPLPAPSGVLPVTNVPLVTTAPSSVFKREGLRSEMKNAEVHPDAPGRMKAGPGLQQGSSHSPAGSARLGGGGGGHGADESPGSASDPPTPHLRLQSSTPNQPSWNTPPPSLSVLFPK